VNAETFALAKGDRRKLQPGTAAFRGVISLVMSMSALAIDLMLPAFTEIRADLGLPVGSSRVAALVTVLFFGLALGQIPAGLAADRFGRKPVLYVGVAIVVCSAAAAALAPTLTTMLVARFFWGLGGATLRVGATATVRDSFAGEAMAREMSFVMAVFILVPIIAPTLGAAIAHVFPWRVLFWICAAMAIITIPFIRLLPESLAVEKQRALNLDSVKDAAQAVWRSRETTLLLAATTALFGAFSGYLSTSSSIFEDVFDMKSSFPLLFGAVAVAMGAAMLGNSHLVMKFGLRSVITGALGVYSAGAIFLLMLALLTGGKPHIALFLPLLALTIAAHGTLLPNTNAAALRPLGALAGTASAVVGTISLTGGAIIGSFISGPGTKTIWPLAIGFVACALTAIPCTLAALRRIPTDS
jgi:MFS transporter, DHA1 family, multidrug resistance protein